MAVCCRKRLFGRYALRALQGIQQGKIDGTNSRIAGRDTFLSTGRFEPFEERLHRCDGIDGLAEKDGRQAIDDQVNDRMAVFSRDIMARGAFPKTGGAVAAIQAYDNRIGMEAFGLRGVERHLEGLVEMIASDSSGGYGVKAVIPQS